MHEQEIRGFIDSLAELYPRNSPPLDAFADVGAVAKLNELIRAAYPYVPKSRVDQVKLLRSPAKAGELMYWIGRTVRILMDRDPAPDAVTMPPLIEPQRFFATTRKTGLKAEDVDMRGKNLTRLDINFIWAHCACQGDDTDVIDLEKELFQLDRTIADYFAGKTIWKRFEWADDADRMGKMRILKTQVDALRATIWHAKKFNPWRPYSDGEINVQFPDSRNQLRAFGSLPPAAAPPVAVLAYRRGRPKEDQLQTPPAPPPGPAVPMAINVAGKAFEVLRMWLGW